MKRILILGKNSYLGKSMYNWLCKYSDEYLVDILSVRDGAWKKIDFTKYDTVINYIGLAHINNIKESMRRLFYDVNRDLVYEIAKKCKECHVRHFIHFSSMNVYGDTNNYITDLSKTNPTSFYGDSKLQGDVLIQSLADNEFIVSLVRPPFVYGPGCSGNYRIISKIARTVPVFPLCNNKKSMIYIDNLCEFTRLVVNNVKSGIFAPQNMELVSTSELVKEIAMHNKLDITFTKIFNILIKYVRIRKFSKAFYDDYYDLSLSNYFHWKYNVVCFSESIKRSENCIGD